MDPLATRLTLIARLKGRSGDADWDVFFQQYSDVIIAFAQKLGLDDHASQDVLQETMIVLMQKLPGFEYDPQQGRFRNWLLTIAANKVRESRRRAHTGRLVELDATPADSTMSWKDRHADDAPLPSDHLETLWRQSLLEEALRRLRHDPQTKAETLDVFEAYVIKQQPIAEVARQFGVNENAIYQIKNRITKRLRDELQALGAFDDEAAGTCPTA